MEKTGLMRFFYAFLRVLKFQRSTDITVITVTETEFKKKTTEGVATGAFTDLAVGQRVQVKGTYVKELTTGKTSLKATSVFILTPVQAALKACQTDSDCAWCGTNCLKKESNRVCIQISPPAGYDCKCVFESGPNPIGAPTTGTMLVGHCKKVLSSSPSTTNPWAPTSTPDIIDKICQEACIAKGYTKSVCRQWAVTAKAKFGCNSNETEIGQTKDCTTVVNGHSLLGIGKTCCCSKGKIETTD
jgi:hypothetical protein